MEGNANVKPELASEAVNVIENVAGTYPGYRRAHARGYMYEGIFTPNGNASPLTVAAHLQDESVPAIIRFSNSSPIPSHPDAISPVKGMAVKFQLPNGEASDLIAVTIPLFFAKTPEAFVDIADFFKSAKDGFPNLKELAKILLKYPESKASLQMLKEMRSPASFSTCQYYSIHAFYFVNAEGRRQAIKYEWVPDAGLSMLAKEEVAKRHPEYLNEEMEERLKQGPVGFKLNIQIGGVNDPTDDSTIAWSEDKQVITVGHLMISNKIESFADHLLFDPTNIPAGIECSEDPILHFRHHAYAISYDRRTHNQ
ncbi:Catalase-related peroxidase [Peribacillus sp. Bi96]|uniref:catalase family peroxidase n=1 Tax=Peribacillus sp. Bi96 TaxID=2884273 RepID=UPI001D788724|nr:catalase family peroxidase [Peribacillus sp. Bi96]CAH0220092.1 Catalase-related peroxidase [Peribacillus sp. Bi96]